MDSILDHCRNVYGPLSRSERVRLQAVLRNPTEETWEAAHSLIIAVRGGCITLWDAWVQIDPKAPSSKVPSLYWPRIPDQFTLYRAIRTTTRTPSRATAAAAGAAR